MFSNIKPLSEDPILHLTTLFIQDNKPNKLDCGVGVYRNEQGRTPIMRSVKLAEEHILQSEVTKAYIGLAGNELFNQAMIKLVLGDNIDSDKVCGFQSIAGSGGLRLCGELINQVKPNANIYVSDPTWSNHNSIFSASGLNVKTYPFFNRKTKQLDHELFLDSLRQINSDDVVVFHGCCHNPTGVSIDKNTWYEVADIAKERGFLVLIDIAYQGFANTLDEDAFAARLLAKTCERVLIVSSCSKNFGLYHERAGAVIYVGQSVEEVNAVKSNLKGIGRMMNSFSPDHGANIVATILNNDTLRESWEKELYGYRERIKKSRQYLANSLKTISGTDDWQFIEKHEGMFSMLCLSEENIKALREQKSIYIVPGGRINLAGFKNEEEINYLADAIVTLVS